MYLDTDSMVDTSTNLLSQPQIQPSQPKVEESVVSTLLDAALFQPATRFSAGNGKRFRATMTTLAYRLAGGLGTPPTGISEAIEMLHAGSLIVDDVEDQTQSRRGEPAIHEQMGVPLAINTGNWMYFAALERLSRVKFTHGSDIIPETLRIVRVCHEGQALDLSARVDELDPHSFRDVVAAISERKTGELMGLAAWLGACAATSDQTRTKAVRDFARDLGVVLQMLNDLGELARAEPRLDDIFNRRVTWPWVWLAENAPAELVEHLQTKLGRAKLSSCYQYVARQLVTQTYSVGRQAVRVKLHRAMQRLESTATEAAAMTDLRSLLNKLENSYE